MRGNMNLNIIQNGREFVLYFMDAEEKRARRYQTGVKTLDSE